MKFYLLLPITFNRSRSHNLPLSLEFHLNELYENSHGIMHHKFSHIRVVLREIDFPLKIYQSKSLNQKKKWLYHQQRAENDHRAALAKREEIKRLEKQQEIQLQERKAAASKL